MAARVEQNAADYPALGANGLAAARRAIREGTRLTASSSLEETRTGYAALFDRAYAGLVLVLGPLGAQAVVRRAIAHASSRRPALRTIVVTESRVALEALLDHGAAPRELRAAADDLFCSTMDVVASLVGVDMLEPMLERVAAAGLNRPEEGRR